jgi:hypothetical protein
MTGHWRLFRRVNGVPVVLQFQTVAALREHLRRGLKLRLSSGLDRVEYNSGPMWR